MSLRSYQYNFIFSQVQTRNGSWDVTEKDTGSQKWCQMFRNTLDRGNDNSDTEMEDDKIENQ